MGKTEKTSLSAAAGKLRDAGLIVIKIGSALLFDQAGGQPDRAWMEGLAADVAQLVAQGKRVVLVSSGSIAIGRQILALPGGRIRLEEKQAAAAVGQVQLAGAWTAALAAHQLPAAQILLAPEDTETRRRHLNARATMHSLLDMGVVPVVNENDTITTYEIRFGDNDRLAARVAAMLSADLLILLSDVDGLYDANPSTDKSARHIAEIDMISEEILQMGEGANAEFASGGMATKLAAGQIATAAGVDMIICNGQAARPVNRLAEGGQASLFHAALAPMAARKNWIAGMLAPKGSLQLDAGASQAVLAGKSLLAAGVSAVTGPFERGDPVRLLDAGGQEIGRGLAGYSSAEADLLKGHKSSAFTALLGYEGRAELIHADDLALLGGRRKNQSTGQETS